MATLHIELPDAMIEALALYSTPAAAASSVVHSKKFQAALAEALKVVLSTKQNG